MVNPPILITFLIGSKIRIRGGERQRTSTDAGLYFALHIKKRDCLKTDAHSCCLLVFLAGKRWEIQNPVEWKNPAIQQYRIAGFDILHNRPCRGRYFDLGSISFASLHEGDKRLVLFQPPSIWGQLYKGLYYSFSRSVIIP